MSLDSATDPLLEVLAAFIRDHVNGATASILGEPAIRALYQHPEILGLAASAELPCLSVTRGPEVGISRSVVHLDQRVQIVVEYVSPPTGRENLGKRWPLLNLVWSELRKAVAAGHSPYWSGAGGATARPLDDVGVQFIFPATFAKVDRFAETQDGAGGYCYPAFRATFDLEARDAPEAVGVPLLSVFVSLDLYDRTLGPHAAEVGEVTLAAPVDLATGIAVANELRAAWSEHVSSTDAHTKADLGAVVDAPEASDLATLCTLTDAIIVAISLGHTSDGDGGELDPPVWHRVPPAPVIDTLIAEFPTLPPDPATDLPSALYSLAVARRAIELHVAQGFADPVIGHVRFIAP